MYFIGIIGILLLGVFLTVYIYRFLIINGYSDYLIINGYY